jgi:hydrogenase maturation protease
LEEGAVRPQPVVRTLIIGLGNTLRGDDGVGVRAARAIAASGLPTGIEVEDGGTQGLGLVSLFEGRERVILIDAADVGLEPGQYQRFRPDEARLLGSDQHLSVHGAGVRDALLLAGALDLLPAEVIIYGVQPARMEWDTTLSPEVEAFLPKLVSAVLEDATG